MSLVDKTFEEITRGLDSDLDKRKACFEYVQKIHWVIGKNPGPEETIDSQEGNCRSKHYLLRDLFNRLSIPSRYKLFVFNWAHHSPPIPKEILDLLKEEYRIEYHLCLEPKIDGREITLDATWDPPLKAAGFPVDDWDGFSGTRYALKPCGPISHRSHLEVRLIELGGALNIKLRGIKIKETPFNDALNDWLYKLRYQNLEGDNL